MRDEPSRGLHNDQQREAARWQYEVIEEARAIAFNIKLNKMSSEGWEPVGSIAIPWAEKILPEEEPFEVQVAASFAVLLRRYMTVP